MPIIDRIVHFALLVVLVTFENLFASSRTIHSLVLMCFFYIMDSYMCKVIFLWGMFTMLGVLGVL